MMQEEPALMDWHRRRISNSIFKKKFGITIDDRDQMASEREYRCDICCQVQTKTLHIDHDHETGVVRGLLCFKCNIALGYMDDSPERLEAAARYLRQRG